MTTFDIDNTKKTKYLEVLESLVEQGHALRCVHNPQTWSLSVLTFALHLYDCSALFSNTKERWNKQLPFSEAWDVDFADWKSKIWSLVIDANSFVSDERNDEWKQLCNSDINAFVAKASECLNGNVPISEVLDFLKDRKTELSEVVVNMGQMLSTILADIDNIPTATSKIQFVEYYDSLMNIYMKEHHDNPYPVNMGEEVVSFEKWIASKTEKQRHNAIPKRLNSICSSMQKDQTWMEVWEENVDSNQYYIDKEGIGREIFSRRRSIIANKIPCSEIMNSIFSSLALCTHLWNYIASQNSDAYTNLPDNRKDIINQIDDLIDKGQWASFTNADKMKAFMLQVLGVGKSPLPDEKVGMSQKLWGLLEKRRGGDALRVTWQNLVGYFDDKGLFGHAGGSPALNEMFFGNQDNYSNIDKGREESKNVHKGFKSVLPLLDAYIPQKG